MSLRQNIAALGIVQLTAYLIPLITIPYLTRTLGIDGWGKIAFATFVLQYFVIIADYGFSLSAVRQIAAVRNDKNAMSAHFSATWVAQWFVAGVAILILTLLVMLIPGLRRDWEIYLAGSALVLGNVLFPIWLMQGLERLKEIAVIQLISRGLAIIPLFLLVKSPKDLTLAMLVQSSAGVVAGLVCLWWIWTRDIARWRKPSFTAVWMAIEDGAVLFLSKIWISLYTNLIPILLGTLAGSTAVGIYSLADRIRLAGQALLNPISQAIFPRMSHLYAHNREAATTMLRKSLLTMTVAGIVISGALICAAPLLIEIMGGKQFAESVIVLRWLSCLPLIVGLSNVFGVQVMIPNKRAKALNAIIFTAGMSSVLLVLVLAKTHGAIGAAISTLIAELIVTVLMFVYIARLGFLSKEILSWKSR